MKSIYQIRCENLNKIRKQFSTNGEMSQQLDVHHQALGQILLGNRKLGSLLARKFEEILNLPSNYLDHDEATIPNEINEIAVKIAKRIVENNIPPAKIFALIDALLVEDK